ncbi:MAG: phosphoenolpyruvate--protein phosphotransferase [Clostridiales bacterium]|jgi:phosphotransferase system enzyme I (PtsI)|nr:phosphoenolpyruvate--protein phosphotransferase [Clostridiales bacterium]
MKKLNGIGASGGIIMGRVAFHRSGNAQIEKRRIEDVKGELSRLETAKKEALGFLNEIYLTSLKRVGEKDSMIFQIHMMMLQDEDFLDAIKNKIEREQVNAEYAVWAVGQEFAARFAQMDSEYMRGRQADVIDISKRLIQYLDDRMAYGPAQMDEPSILAAEDLSPSETMQMDKAKLLAIITRGGSKTSHSAILSRTMGIPSVVGLENGFEELKNGVTVIVDGTSGEVIVEPDENAVADYEKQRKEYLDSQQRLRQVLTSKVVTKDGRTVAINANIGHPGDVESVLKNGADGIGLFRSEFLYMGHDALPSEEEQFQAYKHVLEKMDGKPVIVRTFDIGADKRVPYLNLPEEDNPALGYRAIRICLNRKELFWTQLRALLRASAFGNLEIMFPMIISVDELTAAKAMVEEVKSSLAAESIAVAQDIKIGIMVETPAAVMMSEELAEECDFFSVGTNDLTQYTLAVDRMNGKISKLYNPRHPAVLKMIRMAAENAHKAGIWIGICGESAADPELTEAYLEMGIDELSVAPSSVLELRDHCLNLVK